MVFHTIRAEFQQLISARVLVVDDEPLFLEAIARILSRRGYAVLQASEPRQALEMVQCGPSVDVVLSDVMMPQMRGTDLVRNVAQLAPQAACILMTGGLFNPTEVPPGVPLIRKPISQNDLFAAIERARIQSVEQRDKF